MKSITRSHESCSSSSDFAEQRAPSDETVEAILRVCAYHRRDYDLAIIWFSDSVSASATSDLLLKSWIGTNSSLGVLVQLPIELVNAVCRELDLESLFSFRQVSRRSREVVNSLREFYLIATHATNCLRAILRTRSAKAVTLCDLYWIFCQELCSICQDGFGDMLHLLTWRRCCSSCLQAGKAEIAVMTVGHAKRVLNLSAASVKKLRTLRTLPGIYTMHQTPYKRRYHVASLENVLALYCADNGCTEPPFSTSDIQPHLAYMSCCAFPAYDPNSCLLKHGVSCAGCQLALEWADTSPDALFQSRDVLYSETSFMKHFVHCKSAQDLWKSSNNGTTESPILPEFCNQGGYIGTRT